MSAFSTMPQPSSNYWTDDNLGYSGSPYCEATTSNEGNCSSSGNMPMRVCTPNGDDHYGNHCNWTGCGLNTSTNQWFGGCSNNTTAGTLCCAD